MKIPPSMTITELLSKEFPKSDWAIQGLFAKGSLNMISASPNQYKTWITIHTAICLSKGEPLFGQFDVEKQGVLIINEEDRERDMQNRLKMLLGKEDKSNLPVHFYLLNGFKFTDKGISEAILDEMVNKNLTFLILDPFSSIHTANENDATEMNRLFDKLKKFKRHGITILTAHHNRKNSQPNNNDPSQEMRGSTAISAALDGHLTCEECVKDEEKFVILKQVKLKCDKKLDTPFRVQIKTSKESMRLEYAGKAMNSSVEEKLREQVLGLLEANKKWFTAEDIIQQSQLGENSTRRILNGLSNESKIIGITLGELQEQGFNTKEKGAKNKKYYGSLDLSKKT